MIFKLSNGEVRIFQTEFTLNESHLHKNPLNRGPNFDKFDTVDIVDLNGVFYAFGSTSTNDHTSGYGTTIEAKSFYYLDLGESRWIEKKMSHNSSPGFNERLASMSVVASQNKIFMIGIVSAQVRPESMNLKNTKKGSKFYGYSSDFGTDYSETNDIEDQIDRSAIVFRICDEPESSMDHWSMACNDYEQRMFTSSKWNGRCLIFTDIVPEFR